MRMIKKFMFCTAVLLLAGSVLSAQTDNKENEEFIPDFSSDTDMKELRVKEEPLTFKFGGWISSALIDETGGNDRYGDQKLLSLVTISKLWVKASVTSNMYIYVRGEDIDNQVLDESNRTDDDGSNLLSLDMAFLSWSTERNALQLNIGRKFFNLGTGLVLSDRGDGGELCWYNRIADIQILGAVTDYLEKDTSPYKISGQDNTKRTFIGGTISRKIYNQKLYLLALDQIDNTDEENTAYDSQYYGIGLQGTAGNAFYYGEYIRESGESSSTASTVTGTVVKKTDIKASAFTAGLDYYFSSRFNPVLLFNYAYGSGDSDINDSDDKGFYYFGKYVGGYAFRPVLSNMHIMRAGFSISPGAAFDSRSLKRINILAKYSYYMKDNKNGVINYGETMDTDGTTNGKTGIGSGIDVALRWRIFYDFAVFANYALFMPGDAYSSDEKNRTFIFAGIHLNI